MQDGLALLTSTGVPGHAAYPEAARNAIGQLLLMLRALGLSMYLACLGLDAGTHFFETVMRPEGALWLGIGFALTFVPVVLVGLFALRVLKVDFGSVSGLLCGSMANPMALNYVNDTIEGDNPSVSYATVYPVCMFLRVIIIQVMLMLVL